MHTAEGGIFVGTRTHTHPEHLSIAKAACLWMCPVPWEISVLSVPAMTAAAASSVSSWRAALNAADPIGTPSMSMPCASGSFLAVHRAHLRILGEERPRACAVGVPLALLELECAAIKVEAPFKLRLGCCDGVRRGYGGSTTHDGMAPTTSAPVPPFSRSAPRSQSRWGLNHMQNSAGPSGQPCCVPSTEVKFVHVASVASGALGPRRAQTKGRRRRIGGGASAKRCVRRARENSLKAFLRSSFQTAKSGRSSGGGGVIA
jgi:hypothetical protein